jgi:hypothetical protein
MTTTARPSFPGALVDLLGPRRSVMAVSLEMSANITTT